MKSRCVMRLHQDSCFAHHLGAPGPARRHDRESSRHRLHQGDGKVLPLGRKNEDLGRLEEPRELFGAIAEPSVEYDGNADPAGQRALKLSGRLK